MCLHTSLEGALMSAQPMQFQQHVSCGVRSLSSIVNLKKCNNFGSVLIINMETRHFSVEVNEKNVCFVEETNTW